MKILNKSNKDSKDDESEPSENKSDTDTKKTKKHELNPLSPIEDLISFIEEHSKPVAIKESLAKYRQCSICFEEYQLNDEVRIMPGCHHLFHVKCIDHWLKRFKGVCPIDK